MRVKSHASSSIQYLLRIFRYIRGVSNINRGPQIPLELQDVNEGSFVWYPLASHSHGSVIYRFFIGMILNLM